MKILLAVDGSSHGEEAAREVARRPWPAGSELKVISVVEPAYPPAAEPWGLPDNYFEDVDKVATEKAGAAVEAALTILNRGQDKGLKVSSGTSRGPAIPTIIAEAERWGADLIVVGSHGHGFWHRLLLGSVSQAVVTHAPCSVEIVRRREEKEGG